MAERRGKAKPKRKPAKIVAKKARKTSPRPKPVIEERPYARRSGRRRFEPEPDALEPIPPEPVEDSLLAIAQDAVIILRHELRAKAELAVKHPGWMSMTDCIALLRLTAELGDAAKRGEEGGAANYDRLSPEEREQLAALLLKVDYA